MSILSKLTEGVQQRNLQKEGAAMVAKWENTGLLEGLKTERARNNMALLLENQAKELLRESSSMAHGDVEGFAAVAFPLVRRVFGSLIANDLISVQPMSLPAGLIFFLDFLVNSARLGNSALDSVYGGGVVSRQLTGGVSLTGASAEKGFYNLSNGYSSPTGSTSVVYTAVASGTVGSGDGASTWSGTGSYTNLKDALVRFDPDIASGTFVYVTTAPISSFTNLDVNDLVAIVPVANAPGGRYARRLTVIDLPILPI